MTSLPTLDGPSLPPASGKATSLVILSHGYGSNGEDLIALGRNLQHLFPETAFHAPNAPQPCPQSPGGFQWFPLSTLSRQERDEGVIEAGPVLDKFIDDKLVEYQLDDSRLILIGFSQGTMMSLHVGVRRAKPCAAIVGFSGCLAAIPRLIDEIQSRPPICLVHGVKDEVVPFPLMFETCGALLAAKVPVTTHLSKDTAHSVAQDGLENAATFMKAALEGKLRIE